MSTRQSVFISSTSSDLLAYREAVANVILQLGMYPINMKTFVPTSANALQLCYDKVQEADVFVGIYAYRYGYAPGSDVRLTTPQGKILTGDGETSITQWEYEWARARGILLHLFVIDDRNASVKPVSWWTGAVDEGEAALRLQRFKDDIMRRHVVGFFDSPQSLAVSVAASLARPANRWKPEVLSFVAGMREQLAEMRAAYVPLPMEKDGDVVEPLRIPDEYARLRDLDYGRAVTTLCPIQTELQGGQNTILLGYGGAGKTTALRFYAWARSAEFDTTQGRDFTHIPIYVSLASLEATLTLDQLIANETRIPLADVRHYLENGQIELIADGLNELSEDAETHFIDLLYRFIHEQDAPGRSRLVLTSRPVVTRWEALAIAHKVRIAPLSQQSVILMFRQFLHDEPALAEVEQTFALEDAGRWQNPSSVQTMLQSPLVVRMIADIVTRATHKPGTFHMPRMRGELFSRWIHFKILEWEDRRGGTAYFGADDCIEALNQLAFAMLSQDLGVVVDKNTILAIWHGAYPVLLIEDLVAAGILQALSSDRLTWWHQGVRDTCAAQYLAEHQDTPLQPYLRNREWDDPIVFLIGLLDDAAVKALISDLLAPYPFLAARCFIEAQSTHPLDELSPALHRAMQAEYRRTQEITDDYEQIEGLARQGTEQMPSMRAFLLLGNLLETQGKMAEAIIAYEAASQQPVEEDVEAIEVMSYAGSVWRRIGNFDQAARQLCQALERADERGQHGRDDLIYYELGYLFYLQGHLRLAEAFLDRSTEAGLAEAERLVASGAGEEVYLRKRGFAHMALGAKLPILTSQQRFEEAEALGLTLLDVFRSAKLTRWEHNMLVGLSLLSLERFLAFRQPAHLAHYEEYEARARASVRLYTRRLEPRVQRLRRTALAQLCRSEFARAEQTMLQAAALLEHTSNQEGHAHVFHELGIIQRERQKNEQAYDSFMRALQTNPLQGNTIGIARALRDLASLRIAQVHDLEASVQYVETALRLFTTLESREAASCQQIIRRLQRSRLKKAEYDALIAKLPLLRQYLPHLHGHDAYLRSEHCWMIIDSVSPELLCQSCAMVREPGDVRYLWQGQYWTINLALTTPPELVLGWSVLQPRRHVRHMGELNAAELAEFAQSVARFDQAARETLGVQRTYVAVFAESKEFHLHAHLVPRRADLPSEFIGPGIFHFGASGATPASEADANAVYERLRAWFAADGTAPA